MLNIKTIFICIIYIPVLINAQSFDWLVGKWKMDTDKMEMYEEWKKDNDRLIGESYMIQTGQKKITENLFVQNFAGQWAYIALPKGQAITLFALTEAENNKFVFENKEHDFPQKIIYKYNGDKTIIVSISGEKDGKVKSTSLKLIKVK